MKGFARPSRSDGGHELEIEPSLAEMMHQRPMIVAGRLEPDPNRQVVVHKNASQALKVFERVCDSQSTAALLSRNANQHLMAVLGNVDGDQQGRGVSIGGGHSVLRTLSGVVCAKPLLRLEIRLWPPATLFEGCARGHNLEQVLSNQQKARAPRMREVAARTAPMQKLPRSR